MSPLLPIPIPIAISDYSKEIETAALAALDAYQYTMDEGSGDVETREERYPQPDGGTRAFTEAELKAIELVCWKLGTQVNEPPAGEWVVDFRLAIRCVVEDSNTRTAEDAVIRLLDLAGAILVEDIGANNSTWLETASCVEVLSEELEDPEQDEDNPYLFRRSGVIDLRVYHERLVI